jgi:hypothetical protein
MSNVLDIYKALAVRINYPITPTYRCMQKIIGYINLLMSLANASQATVEVPLSGKPNKRVYNKPNEQIAFLKDGRPCPLNPDGTIRTADATAFVIRTGLFQSMDTGDVKTFVTSENDILSDDYYMQPLLTALYLILSGVQPSEAVMYINDACSRSFTKADMSQVDTYHIKRRL